jgi:arylsulfatase A-like enzyme
MARPNILFVLPDQHRRDFLGVNPDLPVRTPTLDGLAEEGVRFTNAVCPSPLCAPSRAALASGRNYYRCGVPNHDHDYPVEQPTYYRRLREAGYAVAGVGKHDLHKSTPYWGPDGAYQMEAWGFTDGADTAGKWDLADTARRRGDAAFAPYARYLADRGLLDVHLDDMDARAPFRDTHPTPLPDHAYADNWIARQALRQLYGFPADRPWHLVVNFAGPHDPMDVTARMRARWRDVDFPPPHRPDTFGARHVPRNTRSAMDLDRATHRLIRQNYAAMIENIDRHVASFLDAVEARGERDRTLVVFASDHGEMLGDHGRWRKKLFYEASVGVPLIAAGPDVAGGRVSDALVSLHDLAPTFLDAADADPLPDADARPLTDLLSGDADEHRDVLLSALGRRRMVTDGRFKLIEQHGAPDRLYDRASDPWEDTSVADDHPDAVDRLRRAVEALPGVPADLDSVPPES